MARTKKMAPPTVGNGIDNPPAPAAEPQLQGEIPSTTPKVTRTRRNGASLAPPGSPAECGQAPAGGQKPVTPTGRGRRKPPIPQPSAPAPQGEDIKRERENLQARREEIHRELESFRQQAQMAHQQFLRETQESSERLRKEAVATETQLGEVKRLFQEAGQQFVKELEKQLDQIRQQVREAGRLWEPLPEQARQLQQQLADLRDQLPEARRQLEEVERASEAARQELDAVRQETGAAEGRLASVSEEFLETQRRLQQVRSELERAAQDVDEARQQVQETAAVAEVLAAAATLAVDENNRLGVVVDSGVVVDEVQPGTPAAEAGLFRGDLIHAVNKVPVFSGTELRGAIHRVPNGEEVLIQVIRSGLPLEIRAHLETAPAGEAELPEGRNRLGVVVDPGVVVAKVLPGTPANQAGLLQGDIIRRVNETPVHTGDQLRNAFQQQPPGTTEVRLEVKRAGELQPVTVYLDSGRPEM